MGFFFKSPQEKVAAATRNQAPAVHEMMRNIVAWARGNRPQSKLMMPALFLELYTWYKRNSRYDPDKTVLADTFAAFLEYCQLVADSKPVPPVLSEAVDFALDGFYRMCADAPSDDHAIGTLAMMMASDRHMHQRQR